MTKVLKEIKITSDGYDALVGAYMKFPVAVSLLFLSVPGFSQLEGADPILEIGARFHAASQTPLARSLGSACGVPNLGVPPRNVSGNEETVRQYWVNLRRKQSEFCSQTVNFRSLVSAKVWLRRQHGPGCHIYTAVDSTLSAQYGRRGQFEDDLREFLENMGQFLTRPPNFVEAFLFSLDMHLRGIHESGMISGLQRAHCSQARFDAQTIACHESFMKPLCSGQ